MRNLLGFLLAGILAAVVSVFVKSGGHHWIPVRVVLTVLLLLISLFSLSIWMIPSPPKGTCRPAGGESRLDIAVPKS